MNLTVRIHDIEYVNKIAQGATFSEEYNETLDSGSIRICHISQIDNLRPYDDVYIYESGYDYDEYVQYWRKGGALHNGDKDENGKPYDVTNPNAKRIPFYRHLLVNQYTEEVVNLDTINPETDKRGIFSYSIELFSETKGLEMVQVPNCSVTQPLNFNLKTDIYTYLCRFVDRYSPKYKTVDRSSTSTRKKWTYAKKYSVSPKLKEIFSGAYSQDFTLSNPTLRDVLSTLMITKDMIPYVKDNVIYAKAISERTGTYNIEAQKNQGKINLVVGQMSSTDYCDGVRRQYSDALSQDGTCTFIEYMGFRNKDSALMTLENMRLETTHKIYKIKKVHMCYYKKAQVMGAPGAGLDKGIWFLCRQDITPLVKNSVEWGLLDQDWRELKNPETVEELSQYKIATVSYAIGSKSIDGWGTKYNEYITGSTGFTVYDITKTHIENMIMFMDNKYPFGIDSAEDITTAYKNRYDISPETELKIVPSALHETSWDNLFAPYPSEITTTLKLKLFFFEIEYSGFYDGALIHSRDKGNDNLFQNDNQSSSLTLLEKDGFSQKEKLNRFANKTYTMKGRLDGSNYGVDKLLELGQTGVIGNDNDVIIYRREYSIFDNYVLVSYAGVQDYVLKNFYTSVYAKYRTYQLMSYGESVNRAETEKVMVILSKDKKYKDETGTFLKILGEEDKDITNKILFSAFEPNNENMSINGGIINVGKPSDEKDYFVDVQTFTSGNSLCFNVAMDDNASGGTYLTRYVSNYQKLKEMPSEDKNYVVGSTQNWHKIVDNVETGEIEKLGFEVAHIDKKLSQIVEYQDGKEAPDELVSIYSYSANLPQKLGLVETSTKNRLILGKDYFYKDNKDKIDMTFQIEPIAEKDIVVGEHFLKLSNIVSYNKYEEDTTVYSTGESIVGGSQSIEFKTVPVVDVPFQVEFSMTGDAFNTLCSKIDSASPQDLGFSALIQHDDGSYKFTFYASGIKYYDHNSEIKTERYIKLIGRGEVSLNKNHEVFYEMNFNHFSDPFDDDGNYWGRYACPYEWFKPFIASENKMYGITIPVYTTKTTTIAQNMFVEFNTQSKVDNTYTQKILPPSVAPSTFYDISVKDTFVLNGDGEDSYLRVYIPTTIKDSVESIRYWYFDFDAAYSKDYTDSNYVYQETPQQSSYKFVFGVNINDADRERGYVDIYITKTTHRDPRIFDSLGRQVGVVHNCFDSEGKYAPPKYQEYDETDNLKINLHWINIYPRFENGAFADDYVVVDGDGRYYDGEIAKISVKLKPGYGSWKLLGWKRDMSDDGYFSEQFPLEFYVDGNNNLYPIIGFSTLKEPLVINQNLTGSQAQITVRNDNPTEVILHTKWSAQDRVLDETATTISPMSNATITFNTSAPQITAHMHFEASGYNNSSEIITEISMSALETPVLVSSNFEKRSYTDEQYRYEWDAIVKIKNTNNVTVSPNVDWAVSSGGHTFVPTSLDIAAGEEATFVCNTDMTSAKLTISFSADGYKDSSELVVKCGQSGGQE